MQNVFRSIGLAMILIAAMLLLAGCAGGSGGGDDYAARLRGDAASVAQTTPRPTETPDFGNAQPAMTAPPVVQPVAQQIEVTRETVRETVREVPVVQTVEVPVVQESVREVVVTATPQPVPTCDPRTPAPAIALDATDIAAGVVMRGQWPCWEVK